MHVISPAAGCLSDQTKLSMLFHALFKTMSVNQIKLFFFLSSSLVGADFCGYFCLVESDSPREASPIE